MRRKPGALVPLEVSILEASLLLSARGSPEAHGYLLAKTIRDREAARRLIGYGTLYKALNRLEKLGYLQSRWEDPVDAAAEGRPRRRFYRATAAGERAWASEATPSSQRPRAIARSAAP